MKTDSQVQKDVMEELKWEPSVNATHIGVEVHEGIVTLAGHVDSHAEKWNAERAAQRVSGVKALAIDMDVKLPGSSERTDTDIARTAESVLQWTSALTKGSVKVMVENGWITLSGEVDWIFQRDAAAAAVRPLMGVTGVSDQLVVKHRVSSGTVKADIEAALKRRAAADGRQIFVEVSGADVTLTGQVHSWSERDLACDTAWGTPGVRSVVDHMTIGY